MNGRPLRDRSRDEDVPKVTAKGIAIAVAISLVLALGAAELILRVAMPEWREFHSGRFITTAAVPGYGSTAIGRPNFDGYFSQNNGDFRVRLTLNESGLRNSESLTAADGRIWVVGDSMAFGWGVEHDEMYSQVLARLLGREVYNLASPGTDICGYQTLVARLPAAAKPRAVVIGLILENDLRMYDCAAEFQQAATPNPVGVPQDNTGFGLLDLKYNLMRISALYNFFAVALKRVAVVNELLVAIGLVKQSHVVNNAITPEQIQPLADSAANELVRLRSMLPEGTPYYVLIAPTRFEIRDGDAVFRDLRKAVVDTLEGRGIAVVDPFTAFREAGFAATHFLHDGHWSTRGHQLAAAAIANVLRAKLARQ